MERESLAEVRELVLALRKSRHGAFGSLFRAGPRVLES